MSDEQETKLNSRQEAFINAYLGESKWNATDAAKKAGYTGTDAALRVSASRLLTNANIASRIKERLEEEALPSEEVLARLSEHARADMAPFLSGLGIILEGDAAKMTRLIKKVTIKTKTFKGVEEKEINFELHDSQAALVHLGRTHALFTEKVEATVHDSNAVESLKRKLAGFLAASEPGSVAGEPDGAGSGGA